MSEPVNVVRQMRRFLEPLDADTQWDGKYLIRCVRGWITEMERLEAKVKELEAERAAILKLHTSVRVYQQRLSHLRGDPL